MSSARHAVILGTNFTGLGNRPDFTPAHQVDLQTGIGPAVAEIGTAAELAGDGRPHRL